MMRYAASCTAAGNGGAFPATSVSTLSPAALVSSMSSGRRSSPGAGARGAASLSPRSGVSIVRSSSSASLDADLIALSAARACSGWLSMRSSPMLAWTLMSEMLWPITSCRSLAIRSRSSLC
jgi:hypothetical protein